MFCYQSYSLIRAVLVSISLLGFPPTEKSKLFLQRCVTVLFTEMLFTLTDCQQLNHFLVRCILGIFTLQFILKYKVVFGRQLQIFGVSCQVFICWCVCVFTYLLRLYCLNNALKEMYTTTPYHTSTIPLIGVVWRCTFSTFHQVSLLLDHVRKA